MTTYPDKTTIRYSRGIDKFDNTPLQKTAVNFDAFEAAILADRSPKKGTTFFCGPLSHGPHDRPLEYPEEANYRLASHKSSRKFLATDFDGFSKPAVFDEVFKDLSVFRGFGYSTWSHSDDKPRARAVFLLDREVNRAEGRALGKSFGRMLEKTYGSDAINLDKSVYQNEQPIYSPGPDALIFHFEGRAIEVDVMLAKYPEQNAANASTSPNLGPANASLVKAGYARLTQESLHQVLGFIDCTYEPNWHDVSNALARAYGEEGRQTFIAFSHGDFWGTPYPNFNLDETNEKFDRSLVELQSHPNGYGVRHLVDKAGLSLGDVTFEADTSAPHTLNMVVTANTGSSPVLAFPTVNSKGSPLQVSENLDAVLSAHNITARYNQIRKQCEVLIPGLTCVPDEVSNTALATVTDFVIKSGMTATRIPEMLDAIASQNPFCPVQAYIASRPWDGTMRLHQFAGQIKCSNPTQATLLWRKWLIQCVAAVYEPHGISNAGVIVLTGDQNIGKTKIFKELAKDVPGVFLEGQTLNPSDKDSVMSAASHWIVELGELDATFKKADLAQLKAFITKSTDTLRRPFARKDSVFPRRTVFAGTVNDYEFLHDPTGNRRFWPIDAQAITFDPSIDYQQLWAQAKFWYDSGEVWYLNNAEVQVLNQYSETFMISDPDVEALLNHYPFMGCTLWKEKLMKDVCIDIGIDKPTKPQTMRLAAAIKKYNGGRLPRESNGLKFHYVPDKYAIMQAQNTTSQTTSSGTSGTISAVL
jgi:putative DNA primase/helicase